jgi:hypothetical protein
MVPKGKEKIEIEKTHGGPLPSLNQAVTVSCPDFLGTTLKLAIGDVLYSHEAGRSGSKSARVPDQLNPNYFN